LQGKSVPFEKAEIGIEKEKEFGELRAGIERAFSPASVERFLKEVQREGVRIRDFDLILVRGVLERAQKGLAAAKLYAALPVSDQAQIREFYLSQLENVPPQTRQKFQKVYQYY
jgi:hypothetical protein